MVKFSKFLISSMLFGAKDRFSLGSRFKTNSLNSAAHLELPLQCHKLVSRAAELVSGVARCKMMVVLYARTSRKAQCTYCKE